MRPPYETSSSKSRLIVLGNWFEASPDRAVILYAGPNVSWMTINGEYLELPELQEKLDDILRTRINRLVYVLDSQDADSLVLEEMIAQMPYVARICVIDSRRPPSWYPPKRGPVSGGSGGLVAAALRHEEASPSLIVSYPLR
jgi:hypothetical protein